MSEPLYVDNTILSAVAKCSTLDVAQYVLGLRTLTESANLKSGAAAHAAWAVYFRGGSVEEAITALRFGAVCRACNGTREQQLSETDDVVRQMKLRKPNGEIAQPLLLPPCEACGGDGRVDAYEPWALEHVPADDRLAPANLVKIMERWFETHPRNMLPFTVKPEHVEVYFEAPLDDAGAFMYCGIMDAFGTYQGGTYNVENKTTGRIDKTWLNAQRLSSQISGYHFLANAYLGHPLVGTFLNVQEFSKLPSDPNRKCKEHGVPYAECGALHAKSEITIVTRTPYQIDQWRKTALHLAKKHRELLRYGSLDQIHRVRQQGTANYSCRYCALQEWCYLERSASYAAANFHVDPWKPNERALARVGAGE